MVICCTAFQTCLADKKQFCPDVQPGHAAVRDCLVQHREEPGFSAPCRSGGKGFCITACFVHTYMEFICGLRGGWVAVAAHVLSLAALDFCWQDIATRENINCTGSAM